MRVVIDTNVLASALFFGGLPKKLLELVFKNEIKAVATEEIISEYRKTDNKLMEKGRSRILDEELSDIFVFMEIIRPKSKVKICRDPDDDKFIACAIDGKCKYIVSGDKDLLEIKSFKNIEILTIREFMDGYYNLPFTSSPH